MTLLMSSSQIFTLVGFYFVLKLFVIDFVFLRFPRLRDKYDTSAQIWHDLPTDADLDARRKTDQVIYTTTRATLTMFSHTKSFNNLNVFTQVIDKIISIILT